VKKEKSFQVGRNARWTTGADNGWKGHEFWWKALLFVTKLGVYGGQCEKALLAKTGDARSVEKGENWGAVSSSSERDSNLESHPGGLQKQLPA